MPKIKATAVDLEKSVFQISGEPFPRGSWWWWFWLFFFDNPKDPKRPRQLMILWSTKNVKDIKCNSLDIRLDPKGIRKKLPEGGEKLEGAVAAWYFDGEKMRHDYLLEQCDLLIGDHSLESKSKTPTSFSIRGDVCRVRIGDELDFIARIDEKSEFHKPNYHANSFAGSLGYGIMKANRLDLKGSAGGKPIRGTAYFQRVFVNAPAIPWYWGAFHFERGATLTYTNQLLFRKAIKKDISFFDGERLHKFKKMGVRRAEGKFPKFEVSGENAEETIRFTVEAYEHSSWTFRKKSLGIVPNKLVYNEYPAAIRDFELVEKATGKKTACKDLGEAIGNAEHTTGYLT